MTSPPDPLPPSRRVFLGGILPGLSLLAWTPGCSQGGMDFQVGEGWEGD